MSIAHWPDSERPREKLILKGPDSLSDAELLAIFIRTGVEGKTALDLARDLLQEFSGLRQLIESDQRIVCQTKGLGITKYVQLQAAIELGKRYLRSTLDRTDVLSSPEMTRDYLKSRLRANPYEVFACLFLDNRHRVISFEELFRGTINGASVHPREVVTQALKHNAAAVILAHNHPSGVAEPSSADVHITNRLKQALELVDIRVLDHIVIGDGETVSFSERGIL